MSRCSENVCGKTPASTSNHLGKKSGAGAGKKAGKAEPAPAEVKAPRKAALKAAPVPVEAKPAKKQARKPAPRAEPVVQKSLPAPSRKAARMAAPPPERVQAKKPRRGKKRGR